MAERILVVEDEEPIRNNVVRLLRIEGFEVSAAADGREGLALARAEPPALVISDVTMPHLDGHALLAALRDDPLTADIPFVFLTARTEHRDLRTGMNLGADDYLLKPFQRDELLAAVRSRLRRAGERRSNSAALQDQAKRLARFDPVTELPNREILTERLQAALRHAERHRVGVALIVFGLDGFGRINDTLGHAAGDAVLREAADRLFTRVNGAMFAGEHDTVARLAGDQFAVLLAGVADDTYVDGFCRELLETLGRPYRPAADDMFLTACAGLAVTGTEIAAPEQLMRNAEVALHHAKEIGPGSLRFYADEMNQRAARRLLLHNELHKALDRGELALHYQPQVDVRSGRIVGFEALMRWRHADLGFVSPVEFIPLAEENGRIGEMGAWALNEAARQTKIWLDAGLGPVRMAVNLSARQFIDDGLERLVARVLDDTKLPPAALELEITESIAMQGVERILLALHGLKRLGVALAMDDFGTGYSSLAYLKRFPLNVLKVDQSFVRNITKDAGDAAITRAVVAMAHSFGLSVIAEGVETQEHLDYLAGLGCEEFQGYFFSKPLPADQAEALLRSARS